MRKFGLIGRKLGHSFSKKYFTEKFEKEGINNAAYELYELEDIDALPELLNRESGLEGLNVTIPYKRDVMKYLDDLDERAERIGAVNVVKITDGKLKGYNSDYYGFRQSLEDWLDHPPNELKAMILGTGGASKAVKVALEDMEMPYQFVSRSHGENQISYQELAENHDLFGDTRLIINTTPLGMYPKVEECPEIPYELLSEHHYLYDLVYNPLETLFMKKGIEKGAKAMNGLPMLELQAEKSWDIWNS
ncbi:shikimate dehydrogenase family protein [Aureibacter tunicatorum]|uniref:Shikimate dehydrogenase n=1 Tax=Aureibacter tunicatorum TaxID=866807 RepID=A0AAE3XKU7_9BACT|nr:shikimate dehydrogenase [Aureibacter tunicatorum]MDR6237848.1 shikimate dehydrogenase [Aureibacter tunicatorum]BDD02883.1 shikimate 5-dehydrogenase [Aureibacter tunicatorum]